MGCGCGGGGGAGRVLSQRSNVVRSGVAPTLAPATNVRVVKSAPMPPIKLPARRTI